MKSNTIFLGVVVSGGIILYAVFAYLAVQSKNVEMRRRWRYSILCGVSYGIIVTILSDGLILLCIFRFL